MRYNTFDGQRPLLTFARGAALSLAFGLSMAHASHIGESLTLDQQFVTSNDQLLAALSKWEKSSAALRAAGTANLVQLAQNRREHMILLLQQNPNVAAARMMPKSLRAKLPAQAAALVEQEVRVQGNVFAQVSDNFAAGRSKSTFKIQGRSEPAALNIYLADPTGSERDLHRMTGKQAALTAMRVGDNLVVIDKKSLQLQAAGSTTTTSSGGTAVASGTVVQGDQKTLSILVNFTDSSLSCTASDVASRLFNATGATVTNNYQQSSLGLVSFSGQAVGPYTINYASTGTCDYLGWAAAAESAAKAAGIDPSLYSRVNYVTPSNSSCGWTGLAYMPGRQSWVQACGSTGTFSHELGHNLSLHHAATPTFEYGDTSDPMGGAQVVDHNGANRVMAGWMPPGSVQDIASGGAYSLSTISALTATSSPQVLRLVKADTTEYYYVSLREPLNLDAGLSLKYVDTISVHRATGTLPTRTYLLQNLAAGQSYADTVNGITIVNQGVTNGTATVGVAMGAASCLRNVPSVTVSPASQTAGAGTTLAYSVAITNQNSAACGTSTFSLSQALPAGFSGGLGAASLSISAGASASTSWSVTAASAVSDATYTVTASAADTATGVATSAHASDIVYTSTTPTCTPSTPLISVSPSSQSGTAGTTLPYTITVTNRNTSACGTTSFSLAQTVPAGFGGAFGTATLAVAAGASASTTWSVNSTTGVASGTYALKASAANATTGTSSTTASGVIVNSDVTPPVLSITSPANGASVSGRNVTVTASASDASGVQSVDFYVDGVLLGRDTSTPYAANWNVRKATAGAHTIRVRATDIHGNFTDQSIQLSVK